MDSKQLKPHQNTNLSWVLILLTPFFFYVTHALAFFTHEYAHSFSAWALGFKSNPLILTFGDTSLGNLLFFIKMDENVAFSLFYSAHPWSASFIAFAGILSNAILFLLTVKALTSKKHHGQLYYYFFIWFAVMNLGNFIDYIPSRTFTTEGDIGEILLFLSISPWWMMVIFGYPICFSIWYFYSKILPVTYQNLMFNPTQQAILLVMLTLTLFTLFGGAPGYSNHGELSHLIGQLFIYMTPIVIVACWPTRKWMVEFTCK